MKKPLSIPPEEMERGAGRASEFLKTLSHEMRLRILCLLLDGEKSVGQLARALGQRQAAVSQQLQRLRAEHTRSTALRELSMLRQSGRHICLTAYEPVLI